MIDKKQKKKEDESRGGNYLFIALSLMNDHLNCRDINAATACMSSVCIHKYQCLHTSCSHDSHFLSFICLHYSLLPVFLNFKHIFVNQDSRVQHAAVAAAKLKGTFWPLTLLGLL